MGPLTGNSCPGDGTTPFQGCPAGSYCPTPARQVLCPAVSQKGPLLLLYLLSSPNNFYSNLMQSLMCIVHSPADGSFPFLELKNSAWSPSDSTLHLHSCSSSMPGDNGRLWCDALSLTYRGCSARGALPARANAQRWQHAQQAQQRPASTPAPSSRSSSWFWCTWQPSLQPAIFYGDGQTTGNSSKPRATRCRASVMNIDVKLVHRAQSYQKNPSRLN